MLPGEPDQETVTGPSQHTCIEQQTGRPEMNLLQPNAGEMNSIATGQGLVQYNAMLDADFHLSGQ